MPRKIKLDSLKAELNAVDALLDEAAELNDPVGKLQYSHKKASIQKEIEEIEKTIQASASVAMYFSGKPVIGSAGISAEFAGHMLEEFQELINKVFAKYEYGTLGKRGKAPLKNKSELMVTEISKGSFGFVLEEISDQLELTETMLKKIVEEVSKIISKTTDENETVFEELLSDLDGRTLISLQKFFSYLDNSDAVIRIVEDQNEYILNTQEIHRGRTRTENINIEEDEPEIIGRLVGFLPEHRKFEIKIAEDEIIYGTVTNEAVEQYENFIKAGRQVLNREWKLGIYERTTSPLNRPPKKYYTLLKFIEEIEDDR